MSPFKVVLLDLVIAASMENRGMKRGIVVGTTKVKCPGSGSRTFC